MARPCTCRSSMFLRSSTEAEPTQPYPQKEFRIASGTPFVLSGFEDVERIGHATR
jgi:hypothetical protein